MRGLHRLSRGLSVACCGENLSGVVRRPTKAVKARTMGNFKHSKSRRIKHTEAQSDRETRYRRSTILASDHHRNPATSLVGYVKLTEGYGARCVPGRIAWLRYPLVRINSRLVADPLGNHRADLRKPWRSAIHCYIIHAAGEHRLHRA